MVICLLVFYISGCNGNPPPPEPVEITFVHLDVDTPYFESLVREFGEIYPHITVELRPKSWQLLASSSVADDVDVSVFLPVALCRLYPGRCSASPDELQEEGKILGLGPFIAQDQAFDLSDFYPGTADLYTDGGETLAIPMGMDPIVMYYNVDLFDRYGVPYPETGWTWDDFLNAALAIRDPEAGVFGYAPRSPVLDPLQFVYQHGGRIADDVQHPTTATFDDPLTVEAVEWYTDLFGEYDVAPTPDEAMDEGFGGTVETGIYLNRVGMWMGWFSERGGHSAGSPGTWKMRWDIVPLPRDAQSVATARVGGYFISSQARHPDACWRWIVFLSERIGYGMLPARSSAVQSAEYGQLVGSDIAAVGLAAMEDSVLLPPDLEEYEPLMWVFGAGIERIIVEGDAPEEAMTWAQLQSEIVGISR